jgi:hypothetical protein
MSRSGDKGAGRKGQNALSVLFFIRSDIKGFFVAWVNAWAHFFEEGN